MPPHIDPQVAQAITRRLSQILPDADTEVPETEDPLSVRIKLADGTWVFVTLRPGSAGLGGHTANGKHLGHVSRTIPQGVGTSTPELVVDVIVSLMARRGLIEPETVDLAWTTVTTHSMPIPVHELRLAAYSSDDAPYLNADGTVNRDAFTGSVTGAFDSLLASYENDPNSDAETTPVVVDRNWSR